MSVRIFDKNRVIINCNKKKKKKPFSSYPHLCVQWCAPQCSWCVPPLGHFFPLFFFFLLRSRGFPCSAWNTARAFYTNRITGTSARRDSFKYGSVVMSLNMILFGCLGFCGGSIIIIIKPRWCKSRENTHRADENLRG